MVVLCPNCGREIFSDPDSCVMCGWRRDDPQQPQRREPRGSPPARRGQGGPPPQRPPPRQYANEGYDRDYRRPPPRQDPYRQPPSRRYDERTQGQYPQRDGYYRQDPRMQGRGYQQRPPRQQRGYLQDHEGRQPYPQETRRDPRYYPDDRRGYQEPRPGGPPPRRYEAPPERMARQPRSFRPADGRNRCPNCGREIFGDPSSCVLCGWSKEEEQGRGQRSSAPGEDYPRVVDREYQREPPRRGPPADWERQVDRRVRGRTPPPQSEERKSWYAAEGKGKKKEGARDRFACENCGNPSLQFFADGLGRCPGCGQRFRYSSRPASLRSKQRHKQFICSQCDSKNLQFYLDGRGVCPHCKREFRWRK